MSKSSIEDFDVISRLGSGSYGVVFKVRRRTDEKIYVIKTVRIVDLSVKEQQTAINEVTILSQLQSPFVVHYFDSFISGESLHLVMEYCNKGDLQGLIKKAKEKERTFLPEDLTWDMALQIILGLHYLHGKKILHRDLKAANVFLMKDRDHPFFLVKIGDLGVAKLLDTSTAFAQTIVGTPYYLSPELCADQPYRDKSDCWALGVLLYECCTLRHPFEARNQCALIMKIIQTPVKSPASESVSDELSELILWLLAKDPAKRSSTRDVLNEKIIRKKLEEHGYDLPLDMTDCPLTNYLSRNSSPSTVSSSPTNVIRKGSKHDLPPPPPSSLEGTAKVSARGRGTATHDTHLAAKSPSQDRTAGSAVLVRGGKVTLRGGQVTSPSPRERGVVGNLDISGKKLGSEKEVGVRGDRVRGSQKVQSDKARQRHQVRSPSITASPSPSVGKTKPFYDDFSPTHAELLDDTIIGSTKSAANIAESKMASPLAGRFAFKQDDGRGGNRNRKEFKHQSAEVSPETQPHQMARRVSYDQEDDDEDFNNAATIVTKMVNYKREADTVFQFQHEEKDDGDNLIRKSGASVGSGHRASYNGGVDHLIDIQHRIGSLHVLTDDDQNDDTLCQTLGTALNGSYVPIRASVADENDYYKDDFDESNINSVNGNDSDNNSSYDDDGLDMYNDATVKVMKNSGPSPTEDEKKVRKASRASGGSLKMPVRSDVSPVRGSKAPDFSYGGDEESMTLNAKDSFGSEERTSGRSQLLANALSKDAARLSYMHREKENSVRNSREKRGISTEKIDDDEEDEDLFNHVLGNQRSKAGSSRTAPLTGFDSSKDNISLNGDDDATNLEDEEVSERKVKALERTIDESRSIAISILGQELFSDIYDLCVIGMYSVADKIQSAAKKEEEERHREKLYAQLQSIGVTALELVSGIKTLIAKESNLNAIKERLKLIHRYK